MITQIHIPLESIVLSATSVTIECLNIKGRDPKVFSDLKQASAMLVAGTVGYILEPIRTRTYDIQIKQKTENIKKNNADTQNNILNS